jgi:hypothetical protein
VHIGTAADGQLVKELLASGADLAREIPDVALKGRQGIQLSPVTYFSSVL